MAPLPGKVLLHCEYISRSCACHIEYEIAEEAINFISYVAKFSREWGEPNARDMGRMASQPKAKGEMYILNDGMDMKAKIAAMERRLEELEMNRCKKWQNHLSDTIASYALCHLSEINSQLHQKIENVESSQIKRMDEVQNDLSQKIDNLQDSISRFANLNTMQEKENSPSQPHQNQKGIHEMEAKEGDKEVICPHAS
ncbi:hypothetical protein CK203_108561 [Vitis vinifera]|uniref:Uncharacterized protein n=1 Tax=Vitis vinifera TaxID=29760 RepID=A0A438CF45_VITVI|nr:hypothetical protein CK203_108561 [Vitis vinifera]